MSFDKNHESPELVVDTGKRTTKVNIGVVVGVLCFFVLGGLALWAVTRDPPQSPPTSTPVP